MAIIVVNTSDTIEFHTNIPGAPTNPVPYVLFQLGTWELPARNESGVIIDTDGDQGFPPVLSATDARKLAKWLTKAADDLEGVSSKKNKKKHHFDDDEDDETGGYKF